MANNTASSRSSEWSGADDRLTGLTAYRNTLPAEGPNVPAEHARLEAEIEALVRWNALAMVVGANRRLEGIGGHLASVASIATLFEVGFNHFFRGDGHPKGRDHVYFQGHAAPAVYARAFLEGRLQERQLINFRRELAHGGGLPSYPHPRLMPDFWEFPTVSMGLGPLMAVYQARFDRYLVAHGHLEHAGRVWAFVGDGEIDEPESLAATSLAARESLSNLIFVLDCNLQRLDGPVRSDGKIIQELERRFVGAGWRVIKVVWSDDWEELFEAPDGERLLAHLADLPDVAFQRFAQQSGAERRADLFAGFEALVDGWSDEALGELTFGGHDPACVHRAFEAAAAEPERPTVVLAKTVKGFGLGSAGEAMNVAHKAKTLDADQLAAFAERFALDVSREQLESVAFLRPARESPVMRHLLNARRELGGFVPHPNPKPARLTPPREELFAEFAEGSGDREASTTMVAMRMLAELLDDPELGPQVVPIVPDEARTFGLEALFRKVGIYAPRPPREPPVDADTLFPYREASEGRILEEGISEAGGMASFIAAGTSGMRTAHAMIPMFFFYSMFGFQRIGDLIWAAGDARARGFLFGATSGRTTLNGEGLQHQDGHSHLLACAHPHVRAFDPAYAYELAEIVRDGLDRMYRNDEPLIYYITVGNESYQHPPAPPSYETGNASGGLYRLRGEPSAEHPRVCILASGPMVRLAQEAQRALHNEWRVHAEVWSVTSWKTLYEDCLECDRQSMLSLLEEEPVPLFSRCVGDARVIVAVSDYVRALPALLSNWTQGRLVPLGTDGFGRSESRAALRSFFEIDRVHIVAAVLGAMAREGLFPVATARLAQNALRIDREPIHSLRR